MQHKMPNTDSTAMPLQSTALKSCSLLHTGAPTTKQTNSLRVQCYALMLMLQASSGCRGSAVEGTCQAAVTSTVNTETQACMRKIAHHEKLSRSAPLVGRLLEQCLQQLNWALPLGNCTTARAQPQGLCAVQHVATFCTAARPTGLPTAAETTAYMLHSMNAQLEAIMRTEMATAAAAEDAWYPYTVNRARVQYDVE